jgi:uncharacterized cupredoxin-like copper-binding protein
VASGCGGSSSSPGSAASVVHISERDFKISAPSVVNAGDHVLEVDNHGPDDHELIVLREGKRHAPFRADGLTLDEDAVEPAIAGALEPQEPGTHELRVHLKPGRYVLFCNMSGHYLGGMDKDVEVR